ncbi:bifunctional diaminohydroxyphosphoribosylaminopyrimidine deaminase/5-amino-6-(5-phosphoribosylamino)uracil reductase RibD [Leptobacterium flavescens]|uniref:Riboflavin biosynthesis protein RibD n=1 Tax=Leptobacterium flavescens TaxID=472055 RepID=A0A6P0USF1_9FLAO|nr:bifunctional diaminohydroxyphosphoribosylaminopyrimidine deaminase/5-amino-6-(5-phosphoribosylamino)uracil reductase RibD [Leptobacterium flavescens]NER13296.1 bifunctional diaminohydroxyphosphoribosylaminopyrimidine deaminase/5-amino-6-(5-phosphoribosylamino)uracil reductase RibD [Leptobacterium flavescens]
MKIHEKYINRCIELAKNGLPAAIPNPSVGAVIVHNEKIIGEGYTSPYGGPHAEVNAINSVKQPSLLPESTIYVSLEPCSHFGKTPPCSDLIIAKKIKKVVIGTTDPHDKVSGNGIRKLQAAGCEVNVGVLEKECIDVNRRFFTFHTKKRPYIILKWAQSNDGFISPETAVKDISEAKPHWITNAYSRQLVHKWRSEESGILVGTNTVINDNPKLNTRSWNGKDPVRVILDPKGRIPHTYAVYDGTVNTIVLSGEKGSVPENKNISLEKMDFTTNVGNQICDILYKHQVQSVIIEGGAQTLNTFIEEGLWDEARVFTGSSDLKSGLRAPELNANTKEEHDIKGDRLSIYRNT